MGSTTTGSRNSYSSSNSSTTTTIRWWGSYKSLFFVGGSIIFVMLCIAQQFRIGYIVSTNSLLWTKVVDDSMTTPTTITIAVGETISTMTTTTTTTTTTTNTNDNHSNNDNEKDEDKDKAETEEVGDGPVVEDNNNNSKQPSKEMTKTPPEEKTKATTTTTTYDYIIGVSTGHTGSTSLDETIRNAVMSSSMHSIHWDCPTIKTSSTVITTIETTETTRTTTTTTTTKTPDNNDNNNNGEDSTKTSSSSTSTTTDTKTTRSTETINLLRGEFERSAGVKNRIFQTDYAIQVVVSSSNNSKNVSKTTPTTTDNTLNNNNNNIDCELTKKVLLPHMQSEKITDKIYRKQKWRSKDACTDTASNNNNNNNTSTDNQETNQPEKEVEEVEIEVETWYEFESKEVRKQQQRREKDDDPMTIQEEKDDDDDPALAATFVDMGHFLNRGPHLECLATMLGPKIAFVHIRRNRYAIARSFVGDHELSMIPTSMTNATKKKPLKGKNQYFLTPCKTGEPKIHKTGFRPHLSYCPHSQDQIYTSLDLSDTVLKKSKGGQYIPGIGTILSPQHQVALPVSDNIWDEYLSPFQKFLWLADELELRFYRLQTTYPDAHYFRVTWNTGQEMDRSTRRLFRRDLHCTERNVIQGGNGMVDTTITGTNETNPSSSSLVCNRNSHVKHKVGTINCTKQILQDVQYRHYTNYSPSIRRIIYGTYWQRLVVRECQETTNDLLTLLNITLQVPVRVITETTTNHDNDDDDDYEGTIPEEGDNNTGEEGWVLIEHIE